MLTVAGGGVTREIARGRARCSGASSLLKQYRSTGRTTPLFTGEYHTRAKAQNPPAQPPEYWAIRPSNLEALVLTSISSSRDVCDGASLGLNSNVESSPLSLSEKAPVT